jgi:DNA-binding MarR family transcriptional regulator
MCAAKSSTPPVRPELLKSGSGIYREYLSAEVMVVHAIAQRLGLGATDFFCLNIVSLTGRATAGEIAARTGLTTGATTRLIDRLEAAGFVRRVRDPHDRRRVHVELASDRRADTDVVVEPLRRGMAEVVQDFDDDAVATLLEFFARATPVLRTITAELTGPGAP